MSALPPLCVVGCAVTRRVARSGRQQTEGERKPDTHLAYFRTSTKASFSSLLGVGRQAELSVTSLRVTWKFWIHSLGQCTHATQCLHRHFGVNRSRAATCTLKKRSNVLGPSLSHTEAPCSWVPEFRFEHLAALCCLGPDRDLTAISSTVSMGKCKLASTTDF